MANFFDRFDHQVPPKEQKGRDSDSLRILKAEREKKMSDSDRQSLEREIKAMSKSAGVEYEPPTTPAPVQIPVDKSVKAPPAEDTRYLDAFSRGVNKGYTYGYSAEIEAAKDKAVGKGPYGDRLKVLKGEEAALVGKHPIVSGVGETLGMLLNPLSYVGATLTTKAPRGVQIVANAANQAAVGAAEGYSKNYNPKEAAVGATVGGILSLLGDTGGQIIQRVGDKAARQMVYDKIAEITTKKPPGWDKTLRKVFNASDDISDDVLLKHANDYAYKVKNENASLVEPAPIVRVSKEAAKAEQTAKRDAMKAEFDTRRQAAKEAFEARTGRKVESTMHKKPAEPEVPAKTPRQVMDEEDGSIYTALADPAKYDQVRRERMYADIAKLPREQLNSVEVMDKLAQKHGFDDHIDWARFNQGLPKQDPLRPQGSAPAQGPEGAMGMVDEYQPGGSKDYEKAGDDLYNKMRQDFDGAQEALKKTNQTIKSKDDAVQRFGYKDYLDYLGASLEKSGYGFRGGDIESVLRLMTPAERQQAMNFPSLSTPTDKTRQSQWNEYYKETFKRMSDAYRGTPKSLAPPNTMGMVDKSQQGIVGMTPEEIAAAEKMWKNIKQQPPIDVLRDNEDLVNRFYASMKTYGKDDPRSIALKQEFNEIVQKAGYKDIQEWVSRASPPSPPNTMGMASMPIEQRIEPTFNPDEVLSAARAADDASPGARAFQNIGATATGNTPVPPQPQAPWGANAKSVLDNLAPDATRDAVSGVVKSAGGALVGTAAYHSLPEEWKKYSWILPIIGGAMGAPSGAKAVGDFATNQAMQRAVRGGAYPQMGVPVSAARNVTNQFIPVEPQPDTSNYFNQFDEQPKKGLPGLLDRVRAQWTPTAGE